MAFLPAAVVPIITAAVSIGTTIASIGKGAGTTQPSNAMEIEARRKEELLQSRDERLRRRRSQGTGKSTILTDGEGGSQAEIGRNVLLGQ
jgi:uncharacterized protein (UPF0254 family)